MDNPLIYSDFLMLLAAPLVGSFISVLVARLPSGAPVVLARSKCPGCAHTLAAIDLLPIFSWIFLKGQCRNCDQPIGIAYLIYEISPIVIAIWVITYLPHEIRWVGCMLGWSLFCLAAMDYKYFTLPNVITIPLLFSGILFSIYWDSTPVIDHLLGAIVGYGVLYTISAAYYTLRKREGLGQGDVKLFAAVGAWVSLSGLSSVLLFACVTALLGIGVKVLSGQPLDREEKIPFGAHLCFAAWIVWLYGPLSAVP